MIYYDHDVAGEQPGFRSGEAGFASPHPDGGLEHERRVAIPPNSLHALEQHGVVSELNRLSLQVGPIAPSRDAVIAPAGLDDAARILYAADRNTYGRTWEFVVAEHRHDAPSQYRIVIDNREYQRTLARLVFLVTTASRHGLGVWLRL